MNIQAEQILGIVKGLWENMPKEYVILFSFIGTVFALLNCFMGYRLRKVWGCILGVAAGALAGGAGVYFYTQDKLLAVAGAAAGALILGLLAWVFYKLGVFVMCTGLIYFSVISIFQTPSMKHHIIALVVGVFAGTLALGYEKQLVIGITALCGGIAGVHFLMGMTGAEAGKGEVVLGLILAVFGAIVQAAPFLKGKDLEGKIFGVSKRKRGIPGRRKKKVVKKTIVHTNSKRNIKDSFSSKGKRRKEEADDNEETWEEPQKLNREELDKTQEYAIGQRQYERPKATQETCQSGGLGIDLDDLNRELSREIQKIYHDEN